MIRMPDCSGLMTTHRDFRSECASLRAQFDDALRRVA
jgi:hypothetical protein